MEKKVGIIFLAILILVVLVVATYFTFFFAYKCDTKDCFLGKQKVCRRATYVNVADEITWSYRIEGKTKGSCEILTQILNINEGTMDQEKLEGKGMRCFLEIGDTSAPEAEIANCHGALREGLQEMIIKNLHQYVLDNLGEIDEDFKSI